MHLLIARIPGTGKTCFARWLVEHHGYVRCPEDEEPGASFLAQVDDARAKHENVVIDWGFPVAALPLVRDLIDGGVEPWWFDGDRDAALATFLRREHHRVPREAWDRQIADIDSHWDEIEVLFRGRVLDVVSGGPKFMSNEERFRLMTSTDASATAGS